METKMKWRYSFPLQFFKLRHGASIQGHKLLHKRTACLTPHLLAGPPRWCWQLLGQVRCKQESFKSFSSTIFLPSCALGCLGELHTVRNISSSWDTTDVLSGDAGVLQRQWEVSCRDTQTAFILFAVFVLSVYQWLVLEKGFGAGLYIPNPERIGLFGLQSCPHGIYAYRHTITAQALSGSLHCEAPQCCATFLLGVLLINIG